jgi:hypothetical protein
MHQRSTAPHLPFTGVRGHVVAGLLQIPFVRFHRVQLGFVERPAQYQSFLAEVVGPRIAALPDPLGVFGAGEHTRVLLNAVPELAGRIHCLVDNNSSLWGQERFGRPVLSPVDAVRQCRSMFLSTAVFQHVLNEDLARLTFAGPVIAVDDVVPPAWFLTA